MSINNDDLFLANLRIGSRYLPPTPSTEPWHGYIPPTESQLVSQEHPPFTRYIPSSDWQDGGQNNNVQMPYQSSQVEQLEKPPGSNPAGKPPRFGPRNGPPQENLVPVKNRGGRRGGLSPEERKRVVMMRREGACWPCRLLRNSVLLPPVFVYVEGLISVSLQCKRDDFRQICQGCESTPGKDNLTACCQTPLIDLKLVFLPNILVGPLEYEALLEFRQKTVSHAVDGSSMMVDLDCGFGRPYCLQLREVVPIGHELLVSKQFRLNRDTQRFEVKQAWSPPLEINLSNFESLDLDTYIEDILRNHWKSILKSLFSCRNEWNSIQRKIMRSLRRYHHSFTDKVNTWKVCRP